MPAAHLDVTEHIAYAAIVGAGNRKLDQQGRAIRLYLKDCNPGLNTYFVNSQGHTVYHRPETITAAWRFSRSSSLDDYTFATRPATASRPAADTTAMPA